MKNFLTIAFIIGLALIGPGKSFAETGGVDGGGGNAFNLSDEYIKGFFSSIKPELKDLALALKDIYDAEMNAPSITAINADTDLLGAMKILFKRSGVDNKLDIIRDIERSKYVLKDKCISENFQEVMGASSPGDLGGDICIALPKVRASSLKNAPKHFKLAMMALLFHEHFHHLMSTNSKEIEEIAYKLQGLVLYSLYDIRLNNYIKSESIEKGETAKSIIRILKKDYAPWLLARSKAIIVLDAEQLKDKKIKIKFELDPKYDQYSRQTLSNLYFLNQNSPKFNNLEAEAQNDVIFKYLLHQGRYWRYPSPPSSIEYTLDPKYLKKGYDLWTGLTPVDYINSIPGSDNVGKRGTLVSVYIDGVLFKTVKEASLQSLSKQHAMSAGIFIR